jgi:hypothetical protein
MMIMQSLIRLLAESSSTVIGRSIAPGCDANCPTSTTFLTTFGLATNLLIFAVGAISVIMVVIGGLRYVLSAGNPSGVNDAKNHILYAVIGVAVAISGYAIVTFVTGHFTL